VRCYSTVTAIWHLLAYTNHSGPIQGCISYVQDRLIHTHPLSPIATSMSFNNAPMILDLEERSESVKPSHGRKRIYSEPCLSESLPTTSAFRLPVIFTVNHICRCHSEGGRKSRPEGIDKTTPQAVNRR
jgi:hypothetical protein